MSNKFQQGVSSLGLLVILGIAGFCLLAAFKIGPLYIDNYFVRSSMESIDKKKMRKMTNGQIRRKLSDSFYINNIRDIDMKRVKVERDSKRTLVKLDYEKRINFFGNLDVVVIFVNHVDSTKP